MVYYRCCGCIMLHYVSVRHECKETRPHVRAGRGFVMPEHDMRCIIQALHSPKMYYACTACYGQLQLQRLPLSREFHPERQRIGLGRGLGFPQSSLVQSSLVQPSLAQSSLVYSIAQRSVAWRGVAWHSVAQLSVSVAQRSVVQCRVLPAPLSLLVCYPQLLLPADLPGSFREIMPTRSTFGNACITDSLHRVRHIYIYIICMYVCIYIYIYTHNMYVP